VHNRTLPVRSRLTAAPRLSHLSLFTAITSTMAAELPAYSAADVAAHSTRDDLWVIIQGKGILPEFYGKFSD